MYLYENESKWGWIGYLYTVSGFDYFILWAALGNGGLIEIKHSINLCAQVVAPF